MSKTTLARFVWAFAIALLGAFAWQQAKVEVGTSFKVSELQSAIETHLKSVKTDFGRVESISLKEDENELAVTLTLTGKYLGNEVRMSAVVHGEPGYGAVRKHMLFTVKRVKLEELQTIGKAQSVEVKEPRRASDVRSLDRELGDIVSAAFKTIKAHEMSDEVTSSSWLNYAKVKGDTVELSWNKTKTTTTTLVVLVVIAVLLFILFVCPEVLFFWAIFS